MINTAPGVNDHSIASGSSFSAAGVRYFDGELDLVTTDLSSSGFGSTWGQTRSWTNGFVSGNSNGAGFVDSQQLYLVQATPGSDNTIIVVSSDINARYFDLVGSNYVPHQCDPYPMFVTCPPLTIRGIRLPRNKR